MPVITLPDGSQKQFDRADFRGGRRREHRSRVWPRRRSPARSTVSLVDTSKLIDHDAALSIVTDKDPEGLEIIRHSTAHLLANAVQELFPDAQVTIGPVIEDGFYYDFAYKRPFSTEDLGRHRKAHGRDRRQGFARCTAASCRAMRPWRTSRKSASTTRPRSSAPSRRTNRSACTGRATGRICAAGRTCPAPASSRRSSS